MRHRGCVRRPLQRPGHPIRRPAGRSAARWRGAPEEQGFLRDIQAAACEQFTTVLAPGSNAYHYDHIHVDLMRRASGRIICEPSAVSGEQIAARAGGRNPYALSRDSYVTGSLGGRAHKHKSATAKVNEEDEFEDD